MALLTVQEITRAGPTPTYASATSGGDTFNNDDSERTFLHVKNAGSQITLTIVTAKTSVQVSGYGAVALADITVTIPATTGDKMIGPFPGVRFNTSNGQVAITYSGVTSVTIAAVKVPREIS